MRHFLQIDSKDMRVLYGIIVKVNQESQTAQVEQNQNKRVFEFPFDKWSDEVKDLKVGVECEFLVESKEVVKARIKPKPVDPDEIPVSKSASDCIQEYFARENEILAKYNEFVSGHLTLDFMRMQRFLVTAYNDLCAMDNNIENDVLKKLKYEVAFLSKEFTNYQKKTQYALSYSFELIFLAKQIHYNRTLEHIDEIQGSLANAQARVTSLQNSLLDGEKSLGKREDKGSEEYKELEKNVKAMRKQYVDLVNFIANQKNALVSENARLKRFKEEHFEAFSATYTPMTEDLKKRFIYLLDTKAYDFDSMLWGRAKYSQSVKTFFRNARIEGSFSSKTFLRYFLRGLDKNKLSAKSKELFSLLQYLEENNRKTLMIVRETMVNISKFKALIEKIDSSLLIDVDSDPINALKSSINFPRDIIVIDEKIGDVSALGFIKTYKEKHQDKGLFVVIVSVMPPSEIVSKGKFMGVEFVPEQNMDMLYDVIRMAL